MAVVEAQHWNGGHDDVDGARTARQRNCKIVVAGNGNVGKTSLIRRYAKEKFSEARNVTLGIDITTQEFDINGQLVKLSLWDIEGQAGDRPFFYYGAQAALLVYDVTEPSSLEGLVIWFERVKQHAPPDTPILIAGNKADLPSAVPERWERVFAESAAAQGHLRLSAKTDLNVTRAFNWLAELALARMTADDAASAAELPDR